MLTRAIMYGAPTISFEEGKVLISGRSILLEPNLLYNRLLEQFHAYLKRPVEKTEIHISLDFINSASSRQLLNFLILAEKLFSEGKNVEVFWYFERNDEIVKDHGCIFDELLELPFHFIELSDPSLL